jgi:hypothetical protein
MAPRPKAESPPKGLNSHWTHTWLRALEVMKQQGTWAWELKPLLDEYVFALRGAEDARNGFKWLDHLEEVASEDIEWQALRQIASGLPVQWDKHAKRAAALADQLALTPRGRKAIGLADDEEDQPADPFAALDADELAPRRQKRTQAA